MDTFASPGASARLQRPGPAISPGFTDSNIARPKGTKAYGLVPFEIDAELLGTMHGKNERVPVTQVKRGFELLFRSVVDAAAAQ